MAYRLLDLFCGAGGASFGYSCADFIVTGVDIAPQPNYPFEFIQADAMDFPLDGFDVIHASPPCQRYSKQSRCKPGLAAQYPDYIAELRRRLEVCGALYVIENVPYSPLESPIVLCGQMFGLDLYRHRLFESNATIAQPPHPKHTKPGSSAGHPKPGCVISVAGNVYPIALARDAMGIHWTTRAELVEAIPPKYSEYVGNCLRSQLDAGLW